MASKVIHGSEQDLRNYIKKLENKIESLEQDKIYGNNVRSGMMEEQNKLIKFIKDNNLLTVYHSNFAVHQISTPEEVEKIDMIETSEDAISLYEKTFNKVAPRNRI